MLAGLGLTLAPKPVSAAEYIDGGISDVKPEDKAVVAHPQPVQVLFQFETKDAPNARATKYLKAQVLDTIKASGVFSSVGEEPAPNGAVLSIVIDNVVNPGDMAKAEGQGFATGATFFLVGNTVKDSYLCTVSYVAGPNAPTITKTARHALYTQVGMTAPTPPNAVKIGAMKDALNIMVRQIVSNPLNDVARDPSFQVAEAQAPAAPTTVAAPTPPATTEPLPATPTAVAAPVPPASAPAAPAPDATPKP
jgi:hypothetical protein